MEEVFDLDAFIAGINNDKSKGKSNVDVKERLNRVLMNTKDNQGTLTFIPCYSRGLKNFYLKMTGVYEYYGYTSILDDEAWYRVLPMQFYGDLTDEQKELYNEVKSYLDTLKDYDELDYSEFRTRTYSIFPGIMLKLKNVAKKENKELVDCACLFVYPSANPINGLCNAINTKIDNLNGNKEWITKVLTPNATGRRGVIQINFVPKEGQAGYDCTVSFEMNNSDEGIMVIDPDYTISEEMMSKFDDIIPTFIGWGYDRDHNSYFNEVVFKELRDMLKLRIKELEAPESTAEEESYENKNNLNPSTESKEEVKEEAPAAPRKTPF